MKTLEVIKVPTGHITIAEGEKHKLLEFLSIGDYGKKKNIKADFLGLTNEINGVPHGDLLPLSKKWVITISTQYGCSMDCKFCDVPKVGKGINVTFNDLLDQVFCGIWLHKDIEYTERLNLHFARMGEPLFNWDVINAAIYFAGYFINKHWGFHPVVSTMMPNMLSNEHIRSYLIAWMHVKNEVMQGNAGLQLSINSTDDKARDIMFSGNSMTLEQIAYHTNFLNVVGRKITLNFALNPDYEISGKVLSKYFNPDKFLCKITPLHLTETCKENNYITNDGYKSYTPYKDVETDLKKYGYDVIVFIPSIEEDESRITCGNAILANHNLL